MTNHGGARHDAVVDSLRSDLVAREAVLSAMSEGVMLFDPQGRLAYANPSALTLLGKHFITADSVAPVVLREAITHVQAQVETQRRRQPTTHQLETGDRVVEATVLPTDPRGSVVVVVRDVTEVRRIERLRHDFVANASHELKTPVASILALAETLLKAQDDPGAMSRFHSQLNREAIRLATLVADLLELSRLEGGPLRRTRVRLSRVVAAEARRMCSRAADSGLNLRVAVGSDPVISGSEADLTLMLHNLVDNALRYTPKGGDIVISIGEVNGAAEVSVEDTGIGIPPQDLGRIFERFYRVDTARSRQTGGTGLGLSIVRNVAEVHGGSVHVTSDVGAGSTFTVRLPLHTNVMYQSHR